MLRIDLKLGLLLASAAITTVACGDDTSGGGGAGGPKKLTAAEVAAGGCENETSGGGECKGQDEYTACVQSACASQYDTCLGANWESGDFTGGQCETYMKCVSAAADSCDNDCMIDSTCQSCFTNFSGCASGCISKLDCTGGSGGGAGVGGGKTCADFEACCNSLEPSTKDQCLTQYNQIKAGGDQVCGAAAGIYCP